MRLVEKIERSALEPDESDCVCCGAEYPVGGLWKAKLEASHHKHDEEDLLVCDLCAGTHVSNWFDHDTSDHKTMAILESICFVGNTIRNDIESLLRRLKEKDA